MSGSHTNQRRLYRLLDKLTSKKFKKESDLLESIIKEVVKSIEFDVLGGRVWKLDPINKHYILDFQYGQISRVPNNYKIDIEQEDVKSELKQLVKKRTILSDEKDKVLLDSGIKHYSLTGAGDIVTINGKQYFEYGLGFNAKEFSDRFKESISIIGSVSAIALRNLNSKSIQQKLEKDYKQAKEIQQTLIPDHYLEFKDYEIFGVCVPDSDVGGDYFDYISNKDHADDEETLSIIISDAASKGLPAAIQSLFVSGALRMGMAFASKISHILALLNSLVYNTFPFERFVTLFICELTGSTNRLVLYANAGHCSPIHYSSKEDKFSELKPTGGLLGVIEHQKFEVENIRMQPNDVLVMFTDGINEAQNEEGELLGDDRLKMIIKECAHLPVNEIAYHILEEVNFFSTNSSYTDDKTVVVVKRKAD